MPEWDGSYCVVGGERFRAQFMAQGELEPDAIPVLKAPSMIEMLVTTVQRVQPRRVLELGFYRGGSTALLAAAAPDAQIVAIDITPNPPSTLERFFTRTGAHDRVTIHCGVDQADRATLHSIIAAAFGDELIDLVVDDASHELDRSRASLDALLPLLRPGGCYYLEDWAWTHLMHSPFGQTQPADSWPTGLPLTPLVLEMVMAVGSATGALVDVEVDLTSARAWRGDTPLDPETFTLRQAIHDRDRFLTM